MKSIYIFSSDEPKLIESTTPHFEVYWPRTIVQPVDVSIRFAFNVLQINGNRFEFIWIAPQAEKKPYLHTFEMKLDVCHGIFIYFFFSILFPRSFHRPRTNFPPGRFIRGVLKALQYMRGVESKLVSVHVDGSM